MNKPRLRQSQTLRLEQYQTPRLQHFGRMELGHKPWKTGSLCECGGEIERHTSGAGWVCPDCARLYD